MLLNPDFILFVQHGWADTHHAIAKLAKSLATPKTIVITPNLGYLKTWFRIGPLIEQVEQQAAKIITHYPNIPIRVIGHSMGGLIWLEILERHPEWWSNIQSLILIGSPVGGADLAHILDPLELGIGIAKDLSTNRRKIAEKIAAKIPTLVIAGDLDNGSDGTITIGTTQFSCSNFICVTGISHAKLKNHPCLVEIIQNFWKNPTIITPVEEDFTTGLIQRFQSIPGMIDAHWRDFRYSQAIIAFNNGMSIRVWKNLLQLDHIFIADSEEKCLYAGFVSWKNSQNLYKTLKEIQQQYQHLI